MKLGTLDRTQAGCCSPLLPHIPSATAAHHCSLQPAAADGLLPCMACSLPCPAPFQPVGQVPSGRASSTRTIHGRHSIPMATTWDTCSETASRIGRCSSTPRTAQSSETPSSSSSLWNLHSSSLSKVSILPRAPHEQNAFLRGQGGARSMRAQASDAPPHLATHLRMPHLALPTPSRLAPPIASQALHGVTTY